MNKKVILVIPVLIGVMFLLPLISAAAPSFNLVDNGNYTQSISVTVSVIAAENVTNVTCYRNLTGGAQYPAQNASNFLGTAINSSKGQTSFTVTGTISSDISRKVNITCVLSNNSNSAGILALPGGNATISAKNLTIDSTAPTNGLSLETESLSTRDSILIKWAYADATSGLASYTTTITSPDTQECPTITESGASGEDALVDLETYCPGTYTVTAAVTDFSGNTGDVTKTFKVSSAGNNKLGSNNLGGTTAGSLGQKTLPLGTTGTNLVIIVIIGGAIYLFAKRK
jgi:hypothetical protein